MMMRRRPILVAGAVALFVAPSTSLAQAPTSGQPRRIGFLSADPDRFRDAAESQRPLAIAMRKLGWDVGNTLVIERAFADGKIERLAGLAGELVRKGVEVILVDGQAATLAAARATRSIPIVFYGVGWPVEQGFIDSYSRPGRNVTGTTPWTGAEVAIKRLEFLRQVVPTAKRVSWLWQSDNEEAVDGGRVDLTDQLRVGASRLGFETRFHNVRALADLDTVFSEASAWGAQAVTAATPRDRQYGARIAEFCLRHRLPSAYIDRRSVEAGGLLSFETTLAEQRLLIARAIEYVDRVLRGVRPADLPVQRASTFEVVINLKTAKALGITIPRSVLLRADEVIQ